MSDPIDVATGGYLADGATTTVEKFCGTNRDQLTFPGDPNLNNTAVWATAVTMGVRINWALPEPKGAVAFARLWRNTGTNFSSASIIAEAAGDYYLDPLDWDQGGTYYYWLQLVSINGGEGNVIGPVGIDMQSSIDTMLTYLQDKISSSQLSEDLRQEVANITNIDTALSDEQRARLFNDGTLTSLFEQLRDELGEQGNLITNEIRTRIDENAAIAYQVDLQVSKINNSIALVQEETYTKAETDGAIAGQIETLQASFGGDIGSIQTLNEIVLGDEAAGTTGLLSRHMVRVDSNGYVAGYGLYNDGETADFTIHADNFAIGYPGTAQDGFYPFIVTRVRGVPTISLDADTFIRQASITNAMIGDEIYSEGYKTNGNIPGWFLKKDGTFHLRGAGGSTLLRSLPNGGLEGSSAFLNSQQLWDDIGGSNRPADNADVTLENDFTPVVGWTFNNPNSFDLNNQGFIFDRNTLRLYDDWIQLRSTSNDPKLITPEIRNDNDRLWYRGTRGQYVRARVRRVRGSDSNWDGWCFFSTSRTTSFNGTRVFANKMPKLGEWTTLEWDMSEHWEWEAYDVRRLRFDFTSGINDWVEVDWIAIGHRGSAVTPIDRDNIGIFMQKAVMSEAYIDDLAVSTLKIKDNAVTVPRSRLNTSTRIDLNSTAAVMLLRYPVTWAANLDEAAPSKVIINCFANFDNRTTSGGNNYFNEVGLMFFNRRNPGNPGIIWINQTIQKGFRGSVSFTWEHTPWFFGGDSIWEYRLYAKTSGPFHWAVDKWAISLLGAKK